MRSIFAWRPRLALRMTALGVALVVALLALWPQTAQAAACSVPSGSYATIQSAINDVTCDPINLGAQPFTEAVSVTRSVSIFGAGIDSTILDGSDNSRPLTVDGSGIVVHVSNLTVQNGNTTNVPPNMGPVGAYRIGGGVLVWNGATLYLENVRVQNSHARFDGTGGGFGGGIGVYKQATLHATNVTVTNNYASGGSTSGFGGGVAVVYATAYITDSAIYSNTGYIGTVVTAQGHGGGIYVKDDVSLAIDQTSRLSLYGSAIYSNTATTSTNTGAGLGGGLYAGAAKVVTISTVGNTWYANQARAAASGKGVGNGGAIAFDLTSATTTQLTMNGDTLYQNIANPVDNLDAPGQQAQGGAIYLDANDSGWITATLTNLTVFSNTAQSGSGAITLGQGGALRARLAVVNVYDSSFYDNYARSDGTGQGGAIRTDSAEVTVARSKFYRNRATDGGALYLFNAASELGYADLTNVFVVDNDGEKEDVLIDNDNLAVNNYLRHVTLARQAPVLGQSGLRTASGTILITNTIVTSYTTGLFNTGGDVDGTHNLFFGNTTATTGLVNLNNAVTGDPKFVDPAVYDYHIRSDSAARNAGTNIGVVDDYDGQPRDATPDVGADEYHDQPITGLGISGPVTATVGSPVTFTVQISTGTNVSYTWSYGDNGTGSGQSVNHTYATPGTYTVIVTATNSLGPVTATKSIDILSVGGGDVPIAGLSISSAPTTTVGVPITFTAEITAGTGVGYAWRFGDNTTGSGKTISHTYGSVDSYTVQVTATNSAGSPTAQKVILVVGSGAGETAITGLVATNSSPTLKGNATTLTATVSAGTNVVYAWDYGDGNSGSGATPTHTYAASGVYTATVTAANGKGLVQVQTTVYIGDALVDVEPGGQFIFSPKDVTIPAGGTVVWTLRGGSHSVTADDGSFEQPLGSNWTYFAHTFPNNVVSAAAVVGYYCTLHGTPGGGGMAGTVTIGSPPSSIPRLRIPLIILQ